ncbi:hypothetical protein F0562_033508 [Nyssa sinensis]|uniref:Uncharacterized protein n=1 Tax=Nyssa sinensis TaxID=561372 RepID=A0A5J5AFH0_9ASTE|nr:hypothetical protein F0562_033508 [Nyssa sinensis]
MEQEKNTNNNKSREGGYLGVAIHSRVIKIKQEMVEIKHPLLQQPEMRPVLPNQPVKFSNVGCDIPELKGDNFKMWKERVLLHLGWMDIDYAIRKDEPPAVTNTSTEAEIALYEHWERSNRLSVMFIKTKISAGIRGSVDQHTKVRDLLKAIDEQFVTSDKALARTLSMKFCSTRLDTVKGVREHIMQMRDTTAQLKKLEIIDGFKM